MIEVTIPLRPAAEGEICSADEYFKVIQDEYAERFLALQGIASTAANKAAIIRSRPLEDCEMRSVWRDGSQHSAIASEICIIPPIKKAAMLGSYQEDARVNDAELQQWYGTADRIPIEAPYAPPRTIFLEDDYDEPDKAPSAKSWGVSPHMLDMKTERDDLAAELQRVRQGHKANGSTNRTKADGMSQTRGDQSKGPPASQGTAAKLDIERREVFANEVAVLKQKFILPFCSEKVTEFGRVDLVPWPKEGPLDLTVPRQYLEEVSKPIEISLEDIKRNTQLWIRERLPLEVLTSRRDHDDLKHVRASLLYPSVARLVGLLAHLLYWLTLSKSRRKEDAQLSQSAKESMYVGIHEQWSFFEKFHREYILGVNLVLPCLMLTLKQGIERCFEVQYPSLMTDATMTPKVVDRINTLMMRLFDPDCQYAHFGKGDGTGKAISLSKQLEKITSKGGRLKATHKICRLNRCSPLVSSVVTRGDQGSKQMVSHARTRAILTKGDHPEIVASEAVSPPTDAARQRALLQAALNRLGTVADDSALAKGAASLPPLSARRGGPK